MKVVIGLTNVRRVRAAPGLADPRPVQVSWAHRQARRLLRTPCTMWLIRRPGGLITMTRSCRILVGWMLAVGASSVALSVPSAQARQAALQPLEVTVAGVAGVPADASSVAVNVTVSNPLSPGYVTVYPCGQPVPNASNINFTTSETIPNLVISKVGTAGKICLLSSTPADLLVDVAGYFPTSSGYASIPNPFRLVDTRSGDGLPKARLQPNVPVVVGVAGSAGVPNDASAVVMNVTAGDPQSAGYMTAYPCGAPTPVASNLNFAPHKTIPNLVISKIGGQGTVCVVSSAATDLIIDVTGSFPASSGYAPIANPERVLDTRTGIGAPRARLAPHTPLGFVVAGVAGVPTGATTVVINVAVSEPAAPGYLTVYPCGEAVPNSSNLNFSAGETIPNLIIARVGAGGQLCLISNTSTDVLADVAGYFTDSSTYAPLGNAVRVQDTRSPANPFQFGPGTVAAVPAGRYQAPGGSGCYWERLRGFSGSSSDIIANDLVDGHVIVDIAASDAGFTSHNCGSWSAYEPGIPLSVIDEGVWAVYGHVTPGRYQAPGGPSCYWERLRGFSGEFGDLIANDFAQPLILDVLPTDTGISVHQCGPLTRVG